MDSPSRVGLLAPGWLPEPGTVVSHVEGLARALTAAGVRVAVLAVDRSGRRAPYSLRDERSDGIDVRWLALPERPRLRPEDLAHDERAEAAVRDWLVAVSPELVHVHELGDYGRGVLDALEVLAIPAVASLHDYWSACPRRRLVRPDNGRCEAPEAHACAACLTATWPRLKVSSAEAAARTSTTLSDLKRFARLIVSSHAALRAWMRFGLPKAWLEVVPMGIESQSLFVRSARARQRIGEGHLVGRRLGLLGTARPEKGLVELAHAFCVANLPHVTLEVHGALPDAFGDATYRNALRRLADHEPRVRLHGPFDPADLPLVLATLDAVALPALWEDPDARVLHEARAVGLPVLAAARGAALGTSGDPGVTLVEGDRIKTWVEALWGMQWERTEPVPGVSLLANAERFLALYGEVLQGRAADIA